MVGGKDGTSASGAPPSAMPKGNRVLDAMGEAEPALIFPHLEPMPLHAGLILGQMDGQMSGQTTGGALPWVIFPRAAAVVSLVAVDHGGRTAEAVSIGAEGLIGPELADLPGFGHLQVQMPGPGWRIGTARLAGLAGQSAALREALALAGRTLLVRVLQSAASPRCTRWRRVPAAGCCWRRTAQAMPSCRSPRKCWPRCWASGAPP